MRFTPVLFACLLLFSTPVMAQEQNDLSQIDPQQKVQEQETMRQMPSRDMTDMNVAVLRAIDKVSARRHTFEIPVDKTVKFGQSLFIKARACRKSSPLDLPENAAFLQIWERPQGKEDAQWVFSGWMFSSSPSLSAMEHPVYDVWVIECKNAATNADEEDFIAEEAPTETPAEETDASGE